MKNPYYQLEIYTGQHYIFTLKELMNWIKDDVGNMEKVVSQSYKIEVVWLSKKELNAIQAASI